MTKTESFKQTIKTLGIDLENYPEEAIDFMYKHFCFFEEELSITPDIILQIKSQLGLVKDEENIYLKFIKHLTQNGLLKGNILEVGSGYYPALAQKLRQIPSVNNITAIDPNLTITESPGIHLIKDEFTQDMDIEGYDVIIGFKPCAATIPIIKAANEQQRPFSVVLCECTHFENPYIHRPISIEKWQDHVWVIGDSTLDNGAHLEETFLETTPTSKHYTLTKTYPKNQ